MLETLRILAPSSFLKHIPAHVSKRPRAEGKQRQSPPGGNGGGGNTYEKLLSKTSKFTYNFNSSWAPQHSRVGQPKYRLLSREPEPLGISLQSLFWKKAHWESQRKLDGTTRKDTCRDLTLTASRDRTRTVPQAQEIEVPCHILNFREGSTHLIIFGEEEEKGSEQARRKLTEDPLNAMGLSEKCSEQTPKCTPL